MDKDVLRLMERVLIQNDFILRHLQPPTTVVAVTNKKDRERVFKLMEHRIKDGEVLPVNMNLQIDMPTQKWEYGAPKDGEK